MVLTDQGVSIQSEVNEALVRGGAKVTGFTTLQPSLEDVFLDITGGDTDV
jgi:hypothetical protein